MNEKTRYLIYVWSIRTVCALSVILMVNGREYLAYGLAVVGVVAVAMLEHVTRDKRD